METPDFGEFEPEKAERDWDSFLAGLFEDTEQQTPIIEPAVNTPEPIEQAHREQGRFFKFWDNDLNRFDRSMIATALGSLASIYYFDRLFQGGNDITSASVLVACISLGGLTISIASKKRSI